MSKWKGHQNWGTFWCGDKSDMFEANIFDAIYLGLKDDVFCEYRWPMNIDESDLREHQFALQICKKMGGRENLFYGILPLNHGHG